MAFAHVGDLGTAFSTAVNQSTLVLTTTAALEAGNLGVLIVATDNADTVDGDDNAVGSVADSAGNTWNKAIQFANSQGAARAGACNSIWWCVPATTLPSGGTITITLGVANTIDATAATAKEFTFASSTSMVAVEATNSLATDGPAALGSLDATTSNIACLRVRGIASESSGTTALIATASWALFVQAVSGTGVSATEIGVRGEWIISTGTGAASAPTGGVTSDHASVYAAFKEVLILPIGDNAVDRAGKVKRVAEHYEGFNRANPLYSPLPQNLPFNQFDWSLTALKRPRAFTPDQLDLVQYYTPVVQYAPCFPLEQDSAAKRKPKASEFSQISLAQYFTLLAPENMPYNQFDWPLAARRPPKVQSLDVVTNFVPFNFIDRLPFNEFDWPLAAQPKPTVSIDQLFYPPQFISAVAVTFAPCFPLEQDTAARQLAKAKDFEQPSLVQYYTPITPEGMPFNQFSWPAAAKAKPAKPTISQNLIPLQFVPPEEIPKNIQEWPLAARAKARQDHQLAYSPTFLSGVAVQYTPCVPLEQDNYVRSPAPAKAFLQPNTLPILSSEAVIRAPIFARGPRKLPSALPSEIYVNRIPLSEVVMPAGKSTSMLAAKALPPQAHRQEIFVNRSPFSPPEILPVGSSTSQLATKGRFPQAHRQEIFVNRLPITTVLKPFHNDDWQRPSPQRPYRQDQSTFHPLVLQPETQPFIPPPWQLPARKIRSNPGHNLSSPQLYFAAPAPTPEPIPVPRPRPPIRERVWDDYGFKSPFHRRNKR